MRQWFDIVQNNFNEELEKDIDSNVCVFQIPKSLSSAKPESYSPQLVGLGPYHHLQPQLMEMERVKLDVVKKLHKKSDRSSFTELARKLSKLDLYIRSCYHKFLDIDNDKLSWIMTVDALFLFDLLCRHCIDNQTLKLSPYLGALADHPGKKLSEDAVLRDIMMLENQIPIFFMEKMLTVGSAPLQVAERKTIVEDNFPRMLFGFCKVLSPLKETIDYHLAKVLKRAHLLDLLYCMVMAREDEFEISIPADIINIEEEHDVLVINIEEEHDVRLENIEEEHDVRLEWTGCQVRSLETVSKFVENSNLPFLEIIKPHAKMLQGLIDLFSQVNSIRDSSGSEEAPAEEKALIPTASSLAKAGIKFSKTPFIENISFEEKTHTFHLPVVKLGVNSEVVIRNLVAYEAMAISGPLVFTRFVELMDGLMDTPDDVNLLRKSGIIIGHLKDDEVTHLFNGMSDSIEVNGDCELDKAIKEVNKFYNDAPNIKTQNMVERYVYGAWKVLAMVATVLFLLLMVLQTFCSAYGCSSLVKKTN